MNNFRKYKIILKLLTPTPKNKLTVSKCQLNIKLATVKYGVASPQIIPIQTNKLRNAARE